LKAAYDPRISGVYLHIDSLDCGWGKVEEIRRHILNFKKSGKTTRPVLCCSLDVKIPFFILYDVYRNFYDSQMKPVQNFPRNSVNLHNCYI